MYFARIRQQVSTQIAMQHGG